MKDEQRYFDERVSATTAGLTGEEVLIANTSGENTDFIRLNAGDVRQAGSVSQRTMTVDLIEGQRHVEGTIQLSGDPGMDDARLAALTGKLREQRQLVGEDPFLLYNTNPVSTERINSGVIPDPESALSDIRSAGAGKDMVGIYAAGDTFRGFGNSLGQRSWHQASSFNLDWCFYLAADKAAKNMYAGFQWDDDAFAAKVDWSAQQLAALERKPVELAPGGYRTYLAPVALEELVTLLSWYGSFSLRSHETRQTPFLRMLTDGVELSPEVTISEDTAGGVAPNFQSAGFVRPESVSLVTRGRYADTLVSPRSSKEYGVPTNGASDHEIPESLRIEPGNLPVADVQEALDTGLYVGNLWYTNFSDRAACRTTGMTRFATFWVEGGEVVAPANVLRFDDTAFNLLGSKLEGLTDESEVLLDTQTYSERSTESRQLPGALVSEMKFTL